MSALAKKLQRIRDLVELINQGTIADIDTLVGCLDAIKQITPNVSLGSVAEAARYYGEDASSTFRQGIEELLEAIDEALNSAEVRHA